MNYEMDSLTLFFLVTQTSLYNSKLNKIGYAINDLKLVNVDFLTVFQWKRFIRYTAPDSHNFRLPSEMKNHFLNFHKLCVLKVVDCI